MSARSTIARARRRQRRRLGELAKLVRRENESVKTWLRTPTRSSVSRCDVMRRRPGKIKWNGGCNKEHRAALPTLLAAGKWSQPHRQLEVEHCSLGKHADDVVVASHDAGSNVVRVQVAAADVQNGAGGLQLRDAAHHALPAPARSGVKPELHGAATR